MIFWKPSKGTRLDCEKPRKPDGLSSVKNRAEPPLGQECLGEDSALAGQAAKA